MANWKLDVNSWILYGADVGCYHLRCLLIGAQLKFCSGPSLCSGPAFASSCWCVCVWVCVGGWGCVWGLAPYILCLETTNCTVEDFSVSRCWKWAKWPASDPLNPGRRLLLLRLLLRCLRLWLAIAALSVLGKYLA